MLNEKRKRIKVSVSIYVLNLLEKVITDCVCNQTKHTQPTVAWCSVLATISHNLRMKGEHLVVRSKVALVGMFVGRCCI